MEIDSDPRGEASSPGRTAWWSCAAITVVCLAVALPTVRSDNYFLGDDFGLVQHLHDLPAKRLLSYFASDWTEGIYGFQLDELRPFLAFTYWLDARLFGSVNVSGYHTTNLVLHLLNALLVLAIARSIAPGQPAFAVLAASLFALMPSHSEPVGWISGRVDSLAALFYLGAFLCFVRFRLGNRYTWLFAALLVFTCGLFAKQSIVTFPVLILAFDLLERGSQAAERWSFSRLWPHLLFFALVALYLALRQTLFGNAVRENMLTGAVLEEFFFRQSRYVRELLPTPNSAPRGLRVAAEVVTICMLAACLRWVLARRQAHSHVVRHLIFFGVAWYGITIAPMVVTYLSARHLYITTAGLSIALASLVLPGYPVEERRRTRMRKAMAGVLIALYAVASIWNVSNWVSSGIESHSFAAAVPRLLQSVPRGSIVFVGVPGWHRDGWFWSWTTPFALQPPFTAEDIYSKFTIVEPSAVYCCPPDQWWAAKKTTLMALMDSPEPKEVTYIVFAPDSPAAPVFTTRTIDGRGLKRRIEATLGKSVESFSATITPEEAQGLSRILFELGDHHVDRKAAKPAATLSEGTSYAKDR